MLLPIVIASSNRNKIAELQTVAAEFALPLVTPQAVRQRFGLPAPPDVDEVGKTYRENAMLKACEFVNWSGLPSLGDDSGLEVSALGNRPGVYSARYGGEGLTSTERYELLLSELTQTLAESNSTDRSARFRCYLVLARPNDGMKEAEATLEGEILSAPRGEFGFGYDPIVLIHSFGKTLAEVEFSETCRCGFRALAARKLFSQLRPS